MHLLPSIDPFEDFFLVSKQRESVAVNSCTVYHSIETGSGYKGLVFFCSIICRITKTACYQHMETILDALELEADSKAKALAAQLALMIHGQGGFTSFTDIVFVISADTGKVLDYHVLSKSYQNRW